MATLHKNNQHETSIPVIMPPFLVSINMSWKHFTNIHKMSKHNTAKDLLVIIWLVTLFPKQVLTGPLNLLLTDCDSLTPSGSLSSVLHCLLVALVVHTITGGVCMRSMDHDYLQAQGVRSSTADNDRCGWVLAVLLCTDDKLTLLNLLPPTGALWGTFSKWWSFA